jgi:exosortase
MVDSHVSSRRFTSLYPPAGLAVAVVLLLWAYWTTLGEASQRWAHDPQYSHGYLVPFFAALLLWLRRDKLQIDQLAPSWWGAPLLVAGTVMRLVGAYFYFVWLDPLSLVPCLAGLCLMVGGRAAWRWAWPAIGFLLFMIPLPYTLAVAMTGPLQRIATVASTFTMQTLGMPALSEGNVILVNDAQINIVEACSGLRMLVIFFALSTAVALIIRRPLWEKLVIVASALPIALIANVIRITVTGILHETLGSEAARNFSHDLAGWLMMPIALLLLGIEFKLLQHLLIEPEQAAGPIRLDLGVNRPDPANPRSARARRRSRMGAHAGGAMPGSVSEV